MALKIRLRQQGRTNRLTYRLVVTDSKSPRDGKYLEKLGHYDPHLERDKDGVIAKERVQYWIEQGAELSEKARVFIMRKAPDMMQDLRNTQEERKKKNAQKRRKNAEQR